MLFYVTHTIQTLKCARDKSLKQGSYRAQCADKAASVALVCVKQPWHNNCLLDSTTV